MDSLFIDGTWRAASDGATRTISCPADGREVVVVAEATADDASAAVAAARRAFDTGPWPTTPAPERAALLRRVAARMVDDKDEVARLESLDTGKRFVESQIDVDDIAGDTARLSAGPPAGTQVVTTGAAELYGAEIGVGGGH